MWWNSSLRNRLFATLALGIVGCLAILAVSFDHMVDNELYRRFDDSLTNRARTAALYYGAVAPESLSPYQVLPEFQLGQHREFYQVWDAAGHVVSRSPANQDMDLQRPAQVNDTPRHFDLHLPDQHVGRGVAQTFALPATDERRSLLVVVAEERDQVDALERRLHLILVVGICIIVVVLLILVRVAVHRSLRPVAKYAQQVSLIDTQKPVEVPTPQNDLPSELQPVAQQFSHVLQELTVALSRERRFARDVAHELRTPIAEAKALAETALRNPSLPVMQHHLQEIAAATRELESIVSSLLTIARYEAGIEKPLHEPIDLAEEVRQHLARVAENAQHRRLEMKLDLPKECWVQTDPVLIGRVIANLVDNAVAHAPEDSAIRISLESQPPRLVFDNAAPLLSEALVAQLGQRFVRAPTPASGQHHAGLGLALSQTIAKVLKLELSLRFNTELSPPHLCISLSGFALLPASG